MNDAQPMLEALGLVFQDESKAQKRKDWADLLAREGIDTIGDLKALLEDDWTHVCQSLPAVLRSSLKSIRAGKVYGPVTSPHSKLELTFSNGEYKSVGILGSGAFGEAHLVQGRNGLAMLKFIKTSNREERNQATKELVALARIPKSPYLLEVLDFFEEDAGVCLVLNYCSGGSLAGLIRKGPVPIATASRLMSEIALGLKQLHQNAFIHRDIKPDNILLTEDHKIKIGDFGLARAADNYGQVYTFGCKPYMAPELKMQPMSAASDMWAFGCVLICLLTGVTMEERFAKDRWILGNLSASAISAFLSPILSKTNANLSAIVTGVFELDNTKRLTAEQVSKALELSISSVHANSSLYIVQKSSSLDMVAKMTRRICNNFHDRARSQKEAWEQNKVYAKASQLSMAEAMESCLYEQLSEHSFLRSLPDGSNTVVSPQNPLDKSDKGLVTVGAAAAASFRTCMERVLTQCRFKTGVNGRLLIAPVKGLERVREKMQECGLAIFDLNRATILCEEEIEFTTVQTCLADVFGLPTRFKNKFKVDWHSLTSPPCLFFNLSLPLTPELTAVLVPGSKWIVEVQVTLKCFLEITKFLHPIYEINRVSDAPAHCTVCNAPAVYSDSLGATPTSKTDEDVPSSVTTSSRICIGTFAEGVPVEGKSTYLQSEFKVNASFGLGSPTWAEDIHEDHFVNTTPEETFTGHSFTGESKANTLVKDRNVSFKGELSGKGAFVFPSEPAYSYSQARDSFLQRIATIYSETESESTGLENQTVSQLSEFGVWPELPEVSTADRLPTIAAEGLEAIQAKGGQLALKELQETRLKLLAILKFLNQSALDTLETESKTDEMARARFKNFWTIPPSHSFTGEYIEKLQTTVSFISKVQKENDAQQNEHAEAAKALGFLIPTVGTLEAQIRQIEAEDSARTALASTLTSQLTVIYKRKALLSSLKDAVGALDRGAVLIGCTSGEQVTEVLNGVLRAAAILQEQIKVNIAEHQRLFAIIQTQFTAYSTNLPKVQEAALNSFLIDLEKAIAAYTLLWNQSTLLNQRLEEHLHDEQEPLSAYVLKFVADRTKERKTLAKKLMVAELHVAVINGDKKKIRELCEDKTCTIVDERSSNNVNALQLAIIRGDPTIIQLLASKGADVRQCDDQNHTLLWSAVHEQKPECVRVLIECGADPDRIEGEKCETPLHLTAKAGKIDILELLLQAKASLTTASSDGRTALLHGCAANHADTVKLLVDYGASPNSQDKELDGPLHLTNDPALQSFLVEHGTRIELVNNKKAKVGDPKALKTALEKWKQRDDILMTEPEVKEGDPNWASNEGSQCHCCVENFGLLFSKRHHCRRCGALTCDNCSKKKAVSGKNKIRICDGCFNNLTRLASWNMLNEKYLA